MGHQYVRVCRIFEMGSTNRYAGRYLDFELLRRRFVSILNTKDSGEILKKSTKSIFESPARQGRTWENAAKSRPPLKFEACFIFPGRRHCLHIKNLVFLQDIRNWNSYKSSYENVTTLAQYHSLFSTTKILTRERLISHP